MSLQEIKAWALDIAQRHPGSVIEFTHVAVKVPGAVAGSVVAERAALTGVCTAEGLSDRKREDEMSALELVTHLREVEANPARTASEWAARVPAISARELTRALAATVGDAHVLRHEVKDYGRDHGKKLIRASSLADYLTLCASLEANGQPKPEWWTTVKKGKAA